MLLQLSRGELGANLIGDAVEVAVQALQGVDIPVDVRKIDVPDLLDRIDRIRGHRCELPHLHFILADLRSVGLHLLDDRLHSLCSGHRVLNVVRRIPNDVLRRSCCR